MANLRTPARRATLALLALTILLLVVRADPNPHPDPHASPDPHALADPVPLVVPTRVPPLVRGGDDTIKSVVDDILDDAAPEDVKAGLGDAIEVPGATEAVEPPLDAESGVGQDTEKGEEPAAPAEMPEPAEATNKVELPLVMVDDSEETGTTEEEEPAPEATQDAAAADPVRELEPVQESKQMDPGTPASEKTKDEHPSRAREAMFQDAAEPVVDPDIASNAAANNNNGKPTTSTASRATGTSDAILVPSTTTATATATSTAPIPDSFVDAGQLNLVFAAVAMNKGPNGQNAPSFQLTSDKSGLSFSAQYA
ncbi:hypothetical protein GGF31_008675 [Allomyces arbusculus]|nr:hypothetical protein GGF31_008675 [Allomyces arbusculus]